MSRSYRIALLIGLIFIIGTLTQCAPNSQELPPPTKSEAELALTALVIHNTLMADVTKTAEAESSVQQTQTALIEAFVQQMTQTAQALGTPTPERLNTPTPLIYIQPTIPYSSQDQRIRIQFAPGTYSTTLQGRVAANGINYYVLRAMRGQTMSVSVSSPNNQAVLTIYGLTDGIPLVRGNASGATSYQGVLPLTQDYAIDIISTGNAVDYVVQISIW